MSPKDQILKQIGIYASSTIVTQLITLIAAILSRKFLGPVQTGIWTFIQVILLYASFSALGVTHAMSREVPYFVGKGDSNRADSIKNRVVTFAGASSFFVAIILFISAWFLKGSVRAEIFYGLLFASFFVLMQRGNDLLITILRAYKEFLIAGKQMIYSSIINLIAVAVLSYFFKFYGFMIAMAISLGFNIAYLVCCYRYKILWDWNFKEVKALVAYGFPLMILSLLSAVFLSIDKLMIAKYLGFEELGLYGIAILAVSYMTRFPVSVNTVLLPNFQEEYGRSESIEDLSAFLLKTSSAYVSGMCVFIGLCWMFGPIAIKIVLPDFVGAIPSLQILLLGGFFLALKQPYEHYVIAIKKHLLLFPAIGFSCVLAAILNFIAIKSGYGIFGVAIATCATISIHFLFIYGICSHYAPAEHQYFKRILSILGHFIWVVFTLFVLATFINPVQSVLNAIIAFILYCIVFIPVFVRLDRQLDLTQKIRNKCFALLRLH